MGSIHADVKVVALTMHHSVQISNINISCDAPTLSSVGASNVASSGSSSVTVVGQGGFGIIGSTFKTRVALSACISSSWISDSGILSRVSGGVRRGARSGAVRSLGSRW